MQIMLTRFPENVAENSSSLYLKPKNYLLYISRTLMIVQQMLSYRREVLFSKVFPKYHKNSLSKFSELADRFLRETFEMLS